MFLLATANHNPPPPLISLQLWPVITWAEKENRNRFRDTCLHTFKSEHHHINLTWPIPLCGEILYDHQKTWTQDT